MKKFSALFLILLFLVLAQTQAFASSSYVLPYPSAMPGGITYKVHLVWEKILQYWYYGDFGQFEYNLKESDKYLVEAKTLFEYQQYLLGYSALQKSNDYFSKTLPYLENATKHGKNITDKKLLLHEAAIKHSEVLEKMKSETPETFNWSPEKSPQSALHLHDLIDTGERITKQYE